MSKVTRSVKTGPGLSLFPGVSLDVCKPKGVSAGGRWQGAHGRFTEGFAAPVARELLVGLGQEGSPGASPGRRAP